MPVASTVAPTTRAAYRSLAVGTLREQILDIIEAAGPAGCIHDDVREVFSMSSTKDGTLNTRYSELERDSKIFRSGDTRPGKSGKEQLVMRHANYAASLGVRLPTGRKITPGPGRGFRAGVKWLAEGLVKGGATVHPDVRQLLVEHLRKATRP